MKFAKHLERNANSEWREHYVDYEALKKIVKQTALSMSSEGARASLRTTSLTVAREPQNALHQQFFTFLNSEAITSLLSKKNETFHAGD